MFSGIIFPQINSYSFGNDSLVQCKFKSLKSAVGKSIDYIHAIESGLNLDPILINNLSELNNLTILSNSDCHSLNFHRFGREATKIWLSNKLNYQEIIQSIRLNKIVKICEFKPLEGKNQYDFIVLFVFF